jgi:beta-glucosidase
VERAEKELKAFKKLMVNKRPTTAVNITIPVKDFAYYNSESMKWMVEPGEYKISVGSSSRDIRGTTVVSIQ